MKKVIFKDELKDKLYTAVNLIADATATTLGPCGNNVLINTDGLSPFITNDGVTIARSIEVNDEILNTILDIVKESTLKTNEQVGDGTTTTLVLLKSIFNSGLKEIKKGKNAFLLKKELDCTLKKVIKEIKKLKKDPTKKDLINIAITSSNDEAIGLLASEVFTLVQSRYAINLEESIKEDTYYELNTGYRIEIDNIPNIYFKKDSEIKLNNVYILILRGYLPNIEIICEIVNETLVRNKNVLLFVQEFDDLLNNEIINYKIQEDRNIFLIKTPDFASRKSAIEEDIGILCDAKIKNIEYENVSWNDLGLAKEVIITKDSITLSGTNQNLDEYINSLKDLYNNSNSSYEKEFIASRLAKLTNGIATIYVGGTTKIEKRERIMRFDDAICALNSSMDGIVYGEGITYLQVANVLSEKIISEKIIKEALLEPFKQIMKNAGIDYQGKIDRIINSNFTKIYDFKKNKLVDLNTSDIIDPLAVSIEALKNAISIASILLTTNYLVINDNIDTNKIEL